MSSMSRARPLDLKDLGPHDVCVVQAQDRCRGMDSVAQRPTERAQRPGALGEHRVAIGGAAAALGRWGGAPRPEPAYPARLHRLGRAFIQGRPRKRLPASVSACRADQAPAALPDRTSLGASRSRAHRGSLPLCSSTSDPCPLWTLDPEGPLSHWNWQGVKSWRRFRGVSQSSRNRARPSHRVSDTWAAGVGVVTKK
jgi:hypothetical protein